MMDKNEDGLLSYEEFNAGVAVFLQLSRKARDQLFCFLDLDGTGSITQKDFVDMLVFAQMGKTKVSTGQSHAET
jgi:Ca2+-binding EF-hand superfamily protein